MNILGKSMALIAETIMLLLIFFCYFKPHNCSLNFYSGDVYASWNMTYSSWASNPLSQLPSPMHQLLDQLHVHFISVIYFIFFLLFQAT